MTRKKIREIITVDARISLYQTAMNNAARNFTGKKVSVKKMSEFATELYKLSIKEIGKIGELNPQQIEMTIKKPPVKKVVKSKDLKQLMRRAKNGNGKGRK